MISGTVYNVVMNVFDLSPESRQSFKNTLGTLFEPTAWTTKIGQRLRLLTLGTAGRVAFNYATEPEKTAKQLGEFTFQDYFDVVTSAKYATTILRRAWIQAITDIAVVSWLDSSSANRRILNRPRRSSTVEKQCT